MAPACQSICSLEQIQASRKQVPLNIFLFCLLHEAKRPKVKPIAFNNGNWKSSINKVLSQRGTGKPCLVGHEPVTLSDQTRMTK